MLDLEPNQLKWPGGMRLILSLLLEDALILAGVPQNDIFTRATGVALEDGSLYPIDKPLSDDGTYRHHGLIDDAATPAYSVSPIARPVGLATWGAPSQTWDLTEAGNEWALNLLSFDKASALAYLQSLDPVALYVPGMQEDGLRVDGLTTYLTQLSDLSGNGNHALQPVAMAQTYRDGANSVFSGGQWYSAIGDKINTSDDTTLISRLRIDVAAGYMYGQGAPNRVFISDNISGYADSFDNADVFSIGNTHNVSYKFSGGVGDHYVDGALSRTLLYTGMGQQTINNYIGARNESGSPIFHVTGPLTVFARYNRLLSTQEDTLVDQALTTLGES